MAMLSKVIIDQDDASAADGAANCGGFPAPTGDGPALPPEKLFGAGPPVVAGGVAADLPPGKAMLPVQCDVDDAPNVAGLSAPEDDAPVIPPEKLPGYQPSTLPAGGGGQAPTGIKDKLVDGQALADRFGATGQLPLEPSDSDPLSLLKAGMNELTPPSGNRYEGPWLSEGHPSDGSEAGVAKLVSALATYADGKSAFDSSAFNAKQEDAGLHGALAAAWHS